MNSEKGKEKKQLYRNKNKLKMAQYCKERYEKNKEEITRKNKERYEKNKDKYNESRRAKAALKKSTVIQEQN